MSELVGVIFILALAVILITMWQVQVVPDQNRGVEIEHHNQVQGEMLEVRNSILNTIRGEGRYAEVQLGTTYSQRILGVNPPAPTGTLQTTELQPFEISDTNGVREVCPGTEETRFVEYTPSYSEYQDAPITRYEHTFLYHAYAETALTASNQELIVDDTITIAPIRNEFSKTGREKVSFEPHRGLSRPTDLEDPVLVLPTKLDNETWNELLEDELDEGESVSVDEEQGNVTIDLEGSYTVRCTQVGIDDSPPSGSATDSDDGINPAGAGDVRLLGTSTQGSEVTLHLENIADDTNLTEARINFYETTSQTPEYADIYGEEYAGRLYVRGDYEVFEPEVQLAGEDRTDVVLDFDRNPSSNDWFVLSLILETGEESLYFVSTDDEVVEDDHFNVQIEETNSPIEEGEELTVDVNIYNSGDADGEQEITLEIDGNGMDSEQVDSELVQLGGDAETDITLTWQTGEGDARDYTATVNSNDDEDIEGITVTDAESDIVPPSIDVFDTDTPHPPGSTGTGIDVEWEVSAGSADLDAVEIEIFDNEGNFVDGETVDDINDQEGEGSNRFVGLEDGEEYEVVLTVTDVDGETTSQSRDEIAG
ncbi:CARDB domain-containing protein [Natrialbaceae archaeon A-CW1-1]